ncbi:hypothetical protein D3Y59_12740 [Hymenobacter oligotrophus]|uniref:Uncharacterized protein n=1 Tax=Hymenobacter oligotrophus TaxID=2319843 RepID=A0A3B7R172_9BACT|nr:hypothetical protein [Hymenobacter oligotrophus]AYA37834.1 hypothetical protein D3Y59_12740 [Hymenobacter oligotrophus]
MTDFFTPADLALLHTYANEPHDGSPGHALAERQLLAGVWAKTVYWAEQLAGDGFEAQVRKSAIRRAGTVTNAAGQKRMNRVFKHFTWARLYRPGHEAFKIFFTIGVDGLRQELVWKLDCQHDGTGALDKRLVRRFQEFVAHQAPQVAWQAIPAAQLKRHDWDTVVQASQQFIQVQTHVYDQALDYVWQGRRPEEDKLARICWNTHDWQTPSGPEGKSQAAGSHESDAFGGFGGEEWLFDFSRLWKGYHYAFLQPLNTDSDVYGGRVMNIRLFTRNADTGEYFYVGRIRQAEILTDQQVTQSRAHADAQGWLDGMRHELRAAGSAGTFDPKMFGRGPFNLRFKPEQVERPATPDGLVRIEDISTWTDSQRYVLFDDVSPDETYTPSWQRNAPPVAPQVVLNPRTKRGATARARHVQARSIELRALHEQVQSRLIKHLRQQFPGEEVVKEALIKPFNSYIDAVRRPASGRDVFYEVKVLPTLKACIREALGQLLEYACWPDQVLSREWVVVSYHPATAESTRYLNKLRAEFNLPVEYLQIPLT